MHIVFLRGFNLTASSPLKPIWANVPKELTACPRWVCWKIARGTKVPFDARQEHAHASVSKPETWCGFQEAKEAYITRMNEPHGFDGIGIVLVGDGLVAVDLDHCVMDGQPSLEAQEILQQIGPTYVEISPSGEGIRAFAFANPLAKGIKANLRGVSVELYSNLRYLTVTGHSISPIAVAHCDGFNSIVNEIEELRKKTTSNGQSNLP
jgi:primase-polymerase (primpol)-like protein